MGCVFFSPRPWRILSGAQVLAMFTFDSFSQWNRSPRPLSRHRPCKNLFPIRTAMFKKVSKFYLKWRFLKYFTMERRRTQILLLGNTERASLTSIVATAEPGSPTNFAPISFSAWNSAHHRPGKVTAKKDPAENSSSRQKTAGAGRSQQEQAEAIRSQQKPAAAATAAAGTI